MSQIGWIISLIPDSIFIWLTYAIIAFGVGLYVASKLVIWIPMMGQYKLPAEVVGVVLLSVGMYLFGSYGTEMVWRARVEELEGKVKAAEEKSQQVNVVIQEKVVTKIKVVKENCIIR